MPTPERRGASEVDPWRWRRETCRPERAAIDAEVEGKTICDVLARNAETYPDQPALSWEEGDG